MFEEKQETKRSIKISYKADDSFNQLEEYVLPKKDLSQKRRSSPREKIDDEQNMQRKKKKRARNRKMEQKKITDILRKNKIKHLKKNFTDKMRVNSIYREPYVEEEEEEEKQTWLQEQLESLEKIKGISLGSVGLVVWSLVDVVQVAVMMFLYSIMLAFPVLRDDEVFLWVRVGSTCLFLVDMALNFLVERFEAGKELKNLRDIGGSYLRDGLAVDLVGVVVFVLDLFIGGSMAVLTTGMAITKLWGNLRKLERFEYMYIDSAVREQYYGLVKVFLTNFVIGHVLSILLNLMAPLSATNWWTKLGIQDQDWLVKYIWGYYWGTNIMLTVGFGDLSATNSYEALILIFIETFSCITLAYNISYVGAIIDSIRKTEQEKKKKLKFFHRMSKENEISVQLESKITSFIQQSYQIKKDLPFEEYDQVLHFLPKGMQSEYRKQANKVLFEGFPYINRLSKKSLVNLAEMVERKICHPKEVLYKKGTHPDFLILQKGQLDMACKCSGGKTALSGKVVESLEVKDGQKPKLLGLDFIKNKTLTHDIRSKNYSIVYTLELERFKEALRASEMDYQLLCMLRDRYEYLLDENNVHACSLCPRKLHSKFQCPRLHYCPIKQMVIYRYLDQTNKLKNSRQEYRRTKGDHYPLYDKTQLARQQTHFISDNFNQQELLQVELNNRKQRASFEKKPTTPTQKRPSILSTIAQSRRKLTDKIEDIIVTNIGQNQFWDLEVDQVHNFKYYFPKGNAQKYSQEKKYQLKKEKTFVLF